MILDTLENLGNYVSLNPLFSQVVDYINKTDLASQPEGKVVIDGEKLFVNYCVAKGQVCLSKLAFFIIYNNRLLNST